MDVSEYFMYRVSQKLHNHFRKIKYMYLSVPVAAPAFWHIVAYIHDDTYQLYVPNTLRHF
jgi:hypothetical protein